jgi:hypothetical protein
MQTRIGWPKSMVPNPIIHPSSQQKAKEEGWKKHDMDAIKQIDLIGYIKTYLPHIDRDLKKESPTSVAGPCVNCGSVGHDFSRGPVDRMFVKKTGTWYCRRCEKGGDIVDFVEFAFRTDFDGACKILEKDMGLVSIANIETYAPLPSAPVKKEESAWNYDQMTNLVFEAHDKLMANKGGEADMYIAYLDKRGLDPGTWTQFILGMREVWNPDAKMKLPALAIPWFLPTSSSLHNQKVTAIRTRFLSPPPRSAKVRSVTGSIIEGQLFNYGAVVERIGNGKDSINDAILFIVEGEINAMSVTQATRNIDGLDVISFGSELHIITDEQVEQIARYGTVFVWADKPSIARKKAKLIGTPHMIFSQPEDNSPDRDKHDANDFLAPQRYLDTETERERLDRGDLGKLIAEALLRVAKMQGDRAERLMAQRLLATVPKPNTDVSIWKMANVFRVLAGY